MLSRRDAQLYISLVHLIPGIILNLPMSCPLMIVNKPYVSNKIQACLSETSFEKCVYNYVHYKRTFLIQQTYFKSNFILQGKRMDSKFIKVKKILIF